MTVRLTWVDNNVDETGHQIYRSTSPMDPAALPAPIATLAADVTTYDDTTAPADTNCYYRVAAVRNGELAVSSESMINTAGNIDIHWDNVLFLSHMEGSVIVDEKLNPITGATTAINKTSAKFGTGCFTSNYANQLVVSSNSFAIGVSPYTIEGWLLPSQIPTSDFNRVLFHLNKDNVNGQSNLYLGLAVGGTMYLFTTDGVEGNGKAILNTSRYFHIAVVRTSTQILLFVDGILDMSVDITPSSYASNSLKIGAMPSGNRPLAGLVDEVRFTKDVARYTADFTPPTKAFPNVGP